MLEFRRKWSKEFKGLVQINKKQQKQFLDAMEYIKNSDIKLGEAHLMHLERIREKLLG